MRSNWLLFIIGVIIVVVIINKSMIAYHQNDISKNDFTAGIAIKPADTVWRGWNKLQIPYYSDSGTLIWYGYQLIANTSYYLDPKGTVGHTTNEMNCQYYHLDGGTVPFGNNYGKVYTTCPLFRARNNGVQSIYARVNDCFERSLNGKALDSTSQEMKAIYAYIKWLANGLPKGYIGGGTSLMRVKYLEVAASTEAGKEIYKAKCQSCHSANGAGLLNALATGYTYPPLWGDNSYTDGAGLLRLGNFAGFVKNNMPYGADYKNSALSDEEAWNVAAL